MNEDYYKTLGISENAVSGEIRKAYRKLAFQYHPDRNPGNEEMMKEINEAYAVLSDSRKRKEYDSFRQRYGFSARDQFRQTYNEQDIFRNSDIGQIFEEFSRIFGFSRPEDIFTRSNFYGTQYRTFEFKGPGFLGSGFFFFGPMRKVYQEGTKGSWYQPREVPTTQRPLLPKILLKGLAIFQKYVAKRLGLEFPERGKDFQDEIKITPDEASLGGKIRYHYKKQDNARDLLVKIPTGIRDGQKIRLKGMGEEGRNGGEPGDLYLKVIIHIPFHQKIKNFLKKFK
jgi:curved DNA-binding protein CbpA